MFSGRDKKTGILPWVIVAILLWTTLVFFPVLDNGLTNWDDPEYLAENTLIRDLSVDSIKKMFTSHLTGKYHPLTLLTYAAEYRWFGLTPRVYHLDNLLLHLANVALVFALTRVLFTNSTVNIIVTTLFAIHPLHVEPVAWIASRKDVLSTFFYLLALLAWTKHLRESGRRRWPYVLALISFLFAVLAKASAVTLPLVLFLLDYYFRRPVSRKTLAEKIPFLLVALGLGTVTWMSVEATDSFPVTGLFTIPDRLFLSLYAIFLYLRKLLFPVTVSCFYPLPVKHGAWFPWPVYLAAAAVVFGGWLLWRGRRGVSRQTMFGILFFLIPVLPVLHLIKINDSIVYDRFSYLSSLGIFFVLANAGHYLIKSPPAWRTSINIPKLAKILLPIYILYLSFFSWQRAQVWKNSHTLWSNVIWQFPASPLAYYNRAWAWKKAGRHDLALKDFSQVVRLAPEDPKGYLGRGNVLFDLRQYNPAIRDYTDSLRVDPSRKEAYNNRGNAYLLTGQDGPAMADYTKALEIDPSYTDAYLNRAMGHLVRKETPQALQDLDAVLRIDPDNALARWKKAEILAHPAGL